MSRGVLAGIGFVSHDSQTVRVRLKDRVGVGHWVRQRESCSNIEGKEVRSGWRFPRRVERVLKRTLAGTVAQVLRFASHPLGQTIIRATRTREVLGEKSRWIRELTSVAKKRFCFPEKQRGALCGGRREPCKLRDGAGETFAMQSSVSVVVELVAVSSDSSRKMARRSAT